MEVQLQEDKEMMKQAGVLGMTTTCAAKYQNVRKDIGPRVIIVEEGAEVLEAHIVATLSNKCEHLILIGDHQQLKPSPTVYKLAGKFGLEVSLFERMINNKIENCCLNTQHRMRPKIGEIVKTIYPDLQNNQVVMGYNDFKGISKNVFFINQLQKESPEQDMKSHSNNHEAMYIASLCKYPRLQGYSSNKITILMPMWDLHPRKIPHTV